MKTACMLILIALVLPLSSSLAHAATVRCESLGDDKGNALAIPLPSHVFTISDEWVSEESLGDSLASKDMPDHWKKTFAENGRWQVRRIEKAILRKTVNGEAYLAYYSKWVPRPEIQRRGTIILQHGFGRSSRYFHTMIRLLTYVGFEVITPDGANAGSTLELSQRTRHKMLSQPTPVDDALADRDIILHENIQKFILLGHSRGHAVTALVAAMPEFANRIVAHFPVNPYVMWINDYMIDAAHNIVAPMQLGIRQLVDSQNRVMLWMQTLFPLMPMPQHPVDVGQQMVDTYQTEFANGVALPTMRDLVKESLEHREPYESVPNLDADTEAAGIYNIGLGLAGADQSQPGFSVLALYGIRSRGDNSSEPVQFHDNGFGYTGSGISQIPEQVLKRTYVVRGMNDTLMSPYHVGMLDQNPILQQNRKDITSTHYGPSEQPFTLVDFMMSVLSAPSR